MRLRLAEQLCMHSRLSAGALLRCWAAGVCIKRSQNACPLQLQSAAVLLEPLI